MKEQNSRKRKETKEVPSDIQEIYQRALKLKQKYFLKEEQKNENQIQTFIPYYNRQHQILIRKDQQIVQKRLQYLNKHKLQQQKYFKKTNTNKGSKFRIQNCILNQLRNNEQSSMRYPTMGNVLNFTYKKKGLINQQTFTKPATCINSFEKSQKRFFSAKNFVVKNDKDQVIQSTQNKTKKKSSSQKDLRPKSKTIKIINFLKNSQSKPQIKQPKKISLKSQQNQDNLNLNIENEVQETKKIVVTPWSVLLKTSNPQIIAQMEQLQTQNQRQFTPIGSARHSRTNSRTQSRTSFTISSKKQSSYLSSRLLLSNTKKDNSPKKYLRKGARIRQALLKQLMDPNDPYHNDTNEMAYLRQYDQWVPSALVQNKREQLQQFLGIFVGAKKEQQKADIELQKMDLVYL